MSLHFVAASAADKPKNAADKLKSAAASLASLTKRVQALESYRAVESASSEPVAEAASNAQLLRFSEQQNSHAAALDEKLAAFSHKVRTALLALQKQNADAAFIANRAAVEDARAAAGTSSELQERIGRLEVRVTGLLQEQARAQVRSGNAAVADGGASTMAAAAAGTRAAMPATAAAESASEAAKRALAAAEAAEVAASASARSLQDVVKRQQKAIDEGRERERKLSARIDALTHALAEQSAASSKALAAETQAREQALLVIMQQVRALEHGAQARDAEVRATKLALRNLAIELNGAQA